MLLWISGRWIVLRLGDQRLDSKPLQSAGLGVLEQDTEHKIDPDAAPPSCPFVLQLMSFVPPRYVQRYKNKYRSTSCIVLYT